MALIVLSDARLAFGHVDLLAGCSMSLDNGQRLGLIGRNGTGKSSLLKILAGLERLDDGNLQLQRDLRIAYVAQEPVLDANETVFEAVAHGVDTARRLRQEYENLATLDANPTALEQLHEVQVKLEVLGGWTWEQRVSETLDRLHLDGARVVGSLSGGLKKRVALAQALVALPDVLLLDEPTNHLDIDSIRWLEGLLNEFAGAIIFITHDRAFLNAVCTHIVELIVGSYGFTPAISRRISAPKSRSSLQRRWQMHEKTNCLPKKKSGFVKVSRHGAPVASDGLHALRPCARRVRHDGSRSAK